MKVWQGLFILSILPALVNCASLRDTKQAVSFPCASPQCEVEVKENGQKFQAPSIQKIERRQSITVDFSNGKEHEEQVINGRIRWGDSILANGLFALIPGYGVVLTAAGIATDYFTGNIWELDKPAAPGFKATSSKVSANKIMIAPTLATDANLSEISLPYLKEFAQKYSPSATVETFHQFDEDFSNAGWSYSKAPKYPWMRTELYQKVNTPVILISEIKHVSGQQYSIRLQLHDTVNDSLIKEDILIIEIAKEEFSYAAKAKAWLRDVIPNGLSLTQSTIESAGLVKTEQKNQYYYINDPIINDTEKQQASKSYGISFTNMEPQMGQRLDFIFKWRTDLTFSATSNKVLQPKVNYNLIKNTIDYTYSKSADVTTYSLSPGIGPEIGAVGPLGYLFLNFQYLADIKHHTYSGPNKSGTFTQVDVPVQLNVGYILRITENWQLGASVGTRYNSAESTNDLYSEVLGQPVKTSYSYQTSYSLTLNYYFPWMKKTGRSLVGERQVVSK